ncbi:P-loop containing nucleoside triphosphate hydrolase protein [Scleroderma yunnanense]
MDETGDPGFGFIPNGLLGGLGASGNSQGQSVSKVLSPAEDAFPPISNILGLKVNGDDTQASASSNIASYARCPVRATTFDGRTLYIKRKSRVTERRKPTASSPQLSKLLSVPIHRLIDELSTAEAMKSNIQHNCTAHVVGQPKHEEDTLWVDRYRPKRFTELLGNERVAREVLAWVKQWDWCVFGKKRHKKRARDEKDNYNSEDEYRRPGEKLLLISGPPGLGKTTLAHVVAAQAGYEVMEINASDARTAQVIDDRILPALESGSRVGSTKPILLIIDEIDGATGGGDNSSGFVQKLVSLTFDKPRKKRKGQNSKRPLLRPIICICNDQNAHALSALRPHVRQIRYTRPADVHIVRRLREICEIEELNVDVRALSTLVNIAKGDLRSCLNTLQFIKSKNKDVTEPLIRRATAGMKEADSTISAALNEIFASFSPRRAKDLAMGEEEAARYVSRLSRAIEALNNPASIANGCFAQYPNCHRHEANMSRYQKANDWLVTFDILSSAMYAEGEFELHGYLPFLLVPFHPLCRESTGKRVERDTSDWDSLQLTRINEEIYNSLANGIRVFNGTAGACRHLITGQAFPLEFVPYINRIISPPLRPVNSQIIKPGERALLCRLVEVMVSLGLRFIQEKAEDGQLVYRLDPPIDVFVTYDGKRAPDIAISRYAVRHLVASEIDAALAPRQSAAAPRVGSLDMKILANNPGDDVNDMAIHNAEGQLRENQAGGVEIVPINKRARLQDQIEEKPPVDFFGRPITVPRKVSGPGAPRSKGPPKGFQATYRYLEGNSAAVRKAVKMASFLC